MPVVKRSVAIHPLIDIYVRKVWAYLIEQGYDVTYSTTLNFMLLGAIIEAIKEGGWSERTREIVHKFLEDVEAIGDIDREDMIMKIIKGILQRYSPQSRVSGKR